MERARRLFLLGAFAGVAYLLWRYRSQLSEVVGLSSPEHHAHPTPSERPHSAASRASHGGPAATPAPLGAAPSAFPDASSADLDALAGATPASTDLSGLAGNTPDPTDLSTLAGNTPDAGDLRSLAGPSADADGVDLSSMVGPDAAATTPGFTGGLVNINSADFNALVDLPGIGPALARRIITYREEHGPFRSVDQLIDIQGIGERNIDDFRHLVTV